MQKAKGSWTKVAAVTAMLCILLGTLYAFVHFQAMGFLNETRYRKEVDNFVRGKSNSLSGYDAVNTGRSLDTGRSLEK
jgi:hypothetical protein